MTQWCNYPESSPKNSGYYYARYLNYDDMKVWYKAIYYRVDLGRWMPWRPGNVDDPFVTRYVPDSGCEYYTECLGWVDTQIALGNWPPSD